MAASYLSAPHFHDEQAAIDFVEARVWGANRVCPHCGVIGESKRYGGKSTRLGLWKCYACRKPFTVKIGTIFEDSHVQMHLWLQAIYLVAASKKGISANQLHRTLGVTLKTAWFMGHRIRLAMAGDVSDMGSGGEIIEADETYFGAKEGKRKRAGHGHKHTVFALIQRGGKVKSFHLDGAGKTAEQITEALKVVSQNANIMTDNARWYRKIMADYASHEVVDHSKGEYVRGNVHTNTIENVFSVFKRGMVGTYQHCKEQHLHRYLSEFDFRYNNRVALKISDQQRAENLLTGVSGKRLTYKTTN
ncbi:MAG TPA: IS1595 family transposase [Steroidobacteraceae bacterium]|nr:IS1595 family transposase [Steroidobacteraceae bacterium]